MMEGASHEAASLAGHLGLSKLICVYDDNHITIEGKTDLAYSDDVVKRFEGYHWQVQDLGERANDLEALATAFSQAQQETGRPSLIVLRSHIGYGAPNMQDTKEAHGSPLGEDEIKATKRFYGWPEDKTFYVPAEVLAHMQQVVERGQKLEDEWQKKYEAYQKAHPELAERFQVAVRTELPDGWDQDIPQFKPEDGPMATRSASGKVLSAFAGKVPWLVGGSGDLAPSTNTLMKDSGYFQKGQYYNRNIAWGVREHVMCGASSGMALHGGVRPFAATFFIFTDYARASIRLSALMKQPIIYIMTHDSIGLGEDGPTHQPVEHLASFRAMPQMCTIRPADANETAYAWRAAMERREGPTILVLTRQKVPIFDPNKVANAEGLLKGAYVLSKEKGDKLDIILIASGSEVQLILEAQEKLRESDIAARVVSMPSWELFSAQPKSYRDEVLPPEVKTRLAVEAGSPLGWCSWVGDYGDVIGITQFGASAPAKENFKHYGFTVENVVERGKKLVGR
jgi:transketolase